MVLKKGNLALFGVSHFTVTFINKKCRAVGIYGDFLNLIFLSKILLFPCVQRRMNAKVGWMMHGEGPPWSK
jgi:hypothetical protein